MSALEKAAKIYADQQYSGGWDAHDAEEKEIVLKSMRAAILAFLEDDPQGWPALEKTIANIMARSTNPGWPVSVAEARKQILASLRAEAENVK